MPLQNPPQIYLPQIRSSALAQPLPQEQAEQDSSTWQEQAYGSFSLHKLGSGATAAGRPPLSHRKSLPERSTHQSCPAAEQEATDR